MIDRPSEPHSAHRTPKCDPSYLVFSVDVETDWGRDEIRGIREALPRLLDFLDRYGARATFFVVGELAQEVRPLLDPNGPHEIGSHGHTHTVLDRLDRTGLRRELSQSKRALQEVGYEVKGFRAPFLRMPTSLHEELKQLGYSYDASGGSVWPSRENCSSALSLSNETLPHFSGTALRFSPIPFNLTWLRLLDPIGSRLIPRSKTQVFWCHLHELLEGGRHGGWHAYPRWLRQIHARRCGAKAWNLLEQVLSEGSPRVLSCYEYLRQSQQDQEISKYQQNTAKKVSVHD